jgi:hypothetical protein
MNGHWNRPRPPAVVTQPQPASGDDGDTIQLGLTEYSSAHQLLKAIYLDDSQPLGRRIRCAVAALPFEVPKLTAAAGGPGRDLGDKLEAARKRSGKGLVIEHQPHAQPQPQDLAPEALEPTRR